MTGALRCGAPLPVAGCGDAPPNQEALALMAGDISVFKSESRSHAPHGDRIEPCCACARPVSKEIL